jgi:hypothetical protein
VTRKRRRVRDMCALHYVCTVRSVLKRLDDSLAEDQYCRLEHMSDNAKGRKDEYWLRDTCEAIQDRFCMAFSPWNALIPPCRFRS